MLKVPTRHPHVPFVLMRKQFDKLLIGKAADIDFLAIDFSVRDVVDSSVGSIPNQRVGSMAGVAIVPVDQIDAAVWTILQVEASEPLVVRKKEILAMLADVARTVRDQDLIIDAVAMNVAHEELISILMRPIVAEINHCSRMSVSATKVGNIVRQIGLIAPPGVIANISSVMRMVGDRFDVVVQMRVEMPSALPLVSCTLNDVVEMRNHACGNK